mgnify:CR=1 FL=1
MTTVADLTVPGRTSVMGIVNVTEDSFSDGGKWLATDDAIAHAHELVRLGADIIDVGAESTRPGATRAVRSTVIVPGPQPTSSRSSPGRSAGSR